MAKMITEKTLAEGGQDLETVDKAANTVAMVKPRYGNEFESIPLLSKRLSSEIKILIDIGMLQLNDLQEAIDSAAAAGAGDNGWHASLVSIGNNRNQQQKNRERVSILDFKKSEHTDFTQAIIDGDIWCEKNGPALYFPAGVYFASKSITKSSKTKWIGDGKPTFNITVGSDDKQFLRPGYKHGLSGSCIIWTGEQTETIKTSRTDRFSEFGYMLRTEYFKPNQIQGVGLICDVDCYDVEGKLTTPETDNRAKYDVGFVVDNSMNCVIDDVAVWGYFQKKKGIVVVVRNTDTSNPDYNSFFGVTSYGGVALIGYQSSPNQGLSGTMFHGCSLYDQTYHNRAATPHDDYIDQDVIFMDGQTGSNNTINGLKVIGGCIRSTCPTPLKFDRADGFTMIGVTTECTLNSKYTGQTLNYISVTENTKGLAFFGNRIESWYLRLREVANELVNGSLVVDNDGQGASFIVKKSCGLRYGAPDQLSNDPTIQLSNDFSSFTKGWNIRYSISNKSLQLNLDGFSKVNIDPDGNITPSGRLKKIIGSGSRESRTITSSALTITGSSSYIAVLGESNAADDLVEIKAGISGDIIVLTAYSASQPITIKHNPALIRLKDGVDYTLSNAYANLTLMCTGDRWIEISRTELK